jgi:hypothetical protein
MTDSTRPKPEPDDGGRPQPAVRKKKKKKKQAPSRWPLYAGLAAVGVVALALSIWAVVRLAGGSPPAKAVTAWEKFSSEENEFGFDYPAGWDAKSFGIRDRREAEVKGEGASIIVKQNLAGSLVGDIANAAARGKPVPEELTPVAQVHEMRRPQEPSTYREEPAVTVQTRFGSARRSAYTDGSKRGYRATVLMHRTALDVFCECRASDWETLRPAFEHVIESLGRGQSQGSP